MAMGHAGACEGGAPGQSYTKTFSLEASAGCRDQPKALVLHVPHLISSSSSPFSEAESLKKRRARDSFQPQRGLAIAAA